MGRTYSVAELLSMRDTLPFLICNIKNLNSKIYSDVNMVPEEAHIHSKRNARSSRDMSSITGKCASSCSETPGLAREPKRSHFDVKNGSWSPEDQEEVILFRGNLALQSHEQRQMWMLRKRGSSDRSSQPFPAPSGFEAQKAENFRKFYAAVISPTHLRVTAGGRIVPNTRELPHPTYTWNAENQFFESGHRAYTPVLEQQKSWLPCKNLNAAEPASPLGFVRPTTDGFFGPPLQSHSSTRPAAPNERQSVYSLGVANPDAVGDASTNKIVSTSESDTAVIQGQIKISPPSQFDVFRPFFVNGQPYYPAQPGIQVPANLPIPPFNMLGNLNASYQSLQPSYGMFQPAPLHLPAGNLVHPQPLTLEDQQISQQIPFMQSSGFSPSMLASQLHTPVGQPLGMVPTMPITPLHDEQVAIHPQFVTMVNQIQALQQQLRHLENQLQHNKHQIDEQHVIHQQNHVQNQIRALQSGLNAQIFQPGLLPHGQYGSAMWGIGAKAMAPPLASTTSSGVVPAKADSREISPVHLNGYEPPVQEKAMLGNTEVTIGNPLVLGGGPQGRQSSVPQVPTSRKRLSAAAALAPEFQPRSQLNTSNQPGAMTTGLPMTTANRSPPLIYHGDPGKKAENELPYEVVSWSTPGQWSNSSLMSGPAAMPTGHTMHHMAKGNLFAHSSAYGHYQNPGSFNGVAATRQNDALKTDGVNPYLMGYPPAGIPANTVKSADMIYSRELTREELQARQLYWGKAPRALSKGLPKFDGKDFYAPSPEKAFMSQEENGSCKKNHSSWHSTASSTIPELHSPDPVRSKATLTLQRGSQGCQDRSEGSDSVEQTTYEMIAGTANYSPDTNTASLNAWGMAKADEEEIFDRPACLTSSFDSRVANLGDNDTVKLTSSVSSRPVNDRPAQPSFLQDMLKHTPRTAMAAPTGALSSTVAHGLLPQYGGFAVASLAPSISNVSLSSLSFKNARGSRSGRRSSGLVENQPLLRNSHHQVLANAPEHLDKVKGNEAKMVGRGFNPITKGVGPVYGGSAW